jgi:hypothetical protein
MLWGKFMSRFLIIFALLCQHSFGQGENIHQIYEEFKLVSNLAGKKELAKEIADLCHDGKQQACTLAIEALQIVNDKAELQKLYNTLCNLSQKKYCYQAASYFKNNENYDGASKIYQRLCLNNDIKACNEYANLNLSGLDVGNKDFLKVVEKGCSLLSWKNKSANQCLFLGLYHSSLGQNDLASKYYRKGCLTQKRDPAPCLFYINELGKAGKKNTAELLMAILSKNRETHMSQVKVELESLFSAMPQENLNYINERLKKDNNYKIQSKDKWIDAYIISFMQTYRGTLGLEKQYNYNKVKEYSIKLLRKHGKENNLDNIRLLLSLGLNPEIRYSKKNLPFYFNYYYQGKTEIYKIFEQYGAKVTTKDQTGWTPLFYAALGNQQEVILDLVGRGVNINMTDNRGMTPIMYASQKGKLTAVKVLHKLGADLNQRSLLGSTPLMEAVNNGHVNVTKYLLDNGANKGHANNSGQTAFGLATKSKNKQIINLFKQKL